MRDRQRVLVGLFVGPLVVVLFSESVKMIAESNDNHQQERLG